MIECKCCGKEISKDEEFYIINNRAYCSDCIVEETVTYFKIGDVVCTEDEDDIYKFYDKNDAIKQIEENINFIELRIKSYSESKEEWVKRRNEYWEEEIKKLEKMKKYILGEEENYEVE